MTGAAPRPTPETGRATGVAPATPPAPTSGAARSPAAQRREAARRSDPDEIAARATTTLIEARPGPGRRVSHAGTGHDLTGAGPVPVFADHSGRRARRLRAGAIAATALCASYVTVVAAGALAGPVGPTAAPTLLPAPSSPAPVVIPAPQLDAQIEPEATTTTRAPRTTTTRARATTTRPTRVPARVPATAVPVAPAPVAAAPAAAAPAAPAPGIAAPDTGDDD